MCIYSWVSHKLDPRVQEPYLSRKGHQMVLAKGKYFNVLDNDELIMILVEYGVIYNVS